MTALSEIKDGLGEKIVDCYQHSPKRFYLKIKSKDLKVAADFIFNQLKMRLVTCTGQDTPQGIEILYHFSLDKTGEIFSLRLLLEDKKNPSIETLALLIKGADWIEREMWEMLGINFIGHPNLKRLLLAEEWPKENFPLRHEHEHE